MAGDVWTRAGRFRTTQSKIGVDPRPIAPEPRALLGDVRDGIAHPSYDADEIAVRFSYRWSAFAGSLRATGDPRVSPGRRLAIQL